MLTHRQKISLSRKPGMSTRLERQSKQRIQQPRGFMISRQFSTNAWQLRKKSIAIRTKEFMAYRDAIVPEITVPIEMAPAVEPIDKALA